ncbi:protein late bloomer-like [Rhagoletis pomonella]|uniref:protein late bloomer-like n=1 Tax=Rhagoletis pomonella TaxID=28610 RepID=UPI00177BBB63|nr:protein late bloomer-like [Rhagoletis pomonella]XP_036343861.1 protein late bloomer-like [Rhagoletis pomonella]
MPLTMAFSRPCLQWTVIAFNTTSLIVGILSVVASVYELEKFAEGSAEHMEKIVQLASAGLLILSAFVGCLGAVNGSVRILCCFVTMLIAMIASHIWKLWRYSEPKQMTAAEKTLTAAWLTELVTPGAMNEIQESYECCGVQSSLDYLKLNVKIPLTCYRSENGLRSIFAYNEGCLVALKRAYLTVYRYERLAHALLVCFEGIGILLAMLLICKLLTKSRRYSY